VTDKDVQTIDAPEVGMTFESEKDAMRCTTPMSGRLDSALERAI
jgi:hypothetical protein